MADIGNFSYLFPYKNSDSNSCYVLLSLIGRFKNYGVSIIELCPKRLQTFMGIVDFLSIFTKRSQFFYI